MAKKAKAKQEVERIELGNGKILVKYDDGTAELIIALTAEEVENLCGGESEEEESEDEDDEDDGEEEDDEDDEDEDDDSDEEDEDEEEEEEESEEEVTPEALAGMDFEELEDLCDDKNLDTDPDEYEEEDIEKFRKEIAKELGIKLPAGKGKGKKEEKPAAKGKKGKK